MLRKFGPKALMLIDHLFNLSLKKMIWPWSTADIVFQKKQGKPTYSKPGSYRPITISSYIGKLMEKIIASRLEKHWNKNGFHDIYQEEFSKGRNTVRYLNRLYLNIKDSVNKNQTSICLFIDFEKAFDSVWLKGLIVKFKKSRINGPILHLINNLLFII